MFTPDATQTITLTPRAPLMLERAVGARITALHGQVWITQYGDARDIVLEPGQHFDVELPACLVMAVEGEAEVVLRRPALESPGASAHLGTRSSGLPAWRRWLPLRGGAPSHALTGGGLRRLRLG